MDLNQLNQLESTKNFVEIKQTFKKEDLIRGIELSKDLYGIKIKEKPLTSQEEIIEKYQSLKNFKFFMQSLNQEIGDSETSGSSSTEKRKKRNKKTFGEDSQNLTLAEKKKLLE